MKNILLSKITFKLYVVIQKSKKLKKIIRVKKYLVKTTRNHVQKIYSKTLIYFSNTNTLNELPGRYLI